MDLVNSEKGEWEFIENKLEELRTEEEGEKDRNKEKAIVETDVELFGHLKTLPFVSENGTIKNV